MELQDFIENVIGKDHKDIEWWQMCVRAFILFFVALVLVRISGARTVGEKTPFDYITSIMLGALLARTIPGSAPFFGTIAASLVIVVIHRIIAILTYYSPLIGKWFKGEPVLIFKGKKFDEDAMRKHNITEKDVMENVRKHGTSDSLEEIKEVWFERTGEISVVKKK